MATNEVKLGIGSESGMFFHAPAGTSLPAYPTATLSSDWDEVGDVTGDGITQAFDMSVENLRSWANVIKRVIKSEHTETIQVPIMDTTEEVFKVVLGEDAVEVTQATTTHGKLVKADLSKGTLPPPEAFLFLMKDGDDVMAIGCTKGQITALDNVSFVPNAGITWTPTITALEGGWKILMEEGVPDESES